MFWLGKELFLDIDGKSHRSVLRGWKWEGEGYFLVESPAYSMPFRADKEIVVRFELSGNVYGFKTRYVSTLKKTNLILLAFRKNYEKHSLRAEQRCRCMIPVAMERMISGKLEKVGSGVVSDISILGARIVAKKALPESRNKNLFLTFSDSMGGSVRQVEMLISREEMDDGKVIYAGPFENVSDENRKSLTGFCTFCSDWSAGIGLR